MNPGPWGMAQTGVPFGEVAAVRDWLGISEPVDRPGREHPKRPVEGFACSRSEVSGRRLWGLFRERFKTADRFFGDHFVVNYCPLVFMEQSARNRTPDKLPATERVSLDQACDRHLQSIVSSLQPEFVVGVGAYAEKCLRRVLEASGHDARLARILHPSPASPAANQDWAGKATDQLQQAGVW
jgi:single-strand selective monofunctional uracil DNA glycosylase